MNTILEQINSAGYVFVEFALPMLVQSSVLIVVLLLVDLLLRKKVRAVFRYWLWMLVLLKLILPTTLSSPVSLGSWFGDELTTVKFSETSAPAEPVNLPQMAQARPAEEAGTPPAVTPTADVRPIVTPAPDTKPVVIEAAASSVVSPTPVTWQGIVFLVWATGVAAMGLLLLQRAIFVCRLVAQAKNPTELMNDAFRFCCGQMGLKGKVGLKVSANTASPAVCGLFRPVILLPQNLAPTLGSSHLRPVLLHELAHISRGDLWVNLAQTILQIIYFYNPLLWLANSIIRGIREQAVDEAVQVAMGTKAKQYPQTLVDVAKMAFNRPALSLRLTGVVESKSALKGRIKRMLTRPIPKTAKLGILGLIAVLIFAAVLLPMAKAQEKQQTRTEYSFVTVKEGFGFDDIVVGDVNCTGEFIKSKLGEPDKEVKNEKDWWLNYRETYGLDFWLSPKENVLKEIRLNKGFKGQLTSGISMSSSKQDVFKTYGKPVSVETVDNLTKHFDDQVLYETKGGFFKPNNGKIFYRKNGLLFWFEGDKILQIVIHPKEDTKVGAVDIAVDDFAIRPSREKGRYYVVASIRNSADVTIPAFRLNFYRTDPSRNLNERGYPHSGHHGAGPIEPSNVWNERSSDFALDEGLNEFFVVLDMDGQVAESDEANNRASMKVVVEDGRIIEKSVSYSPQQKKVVRSRLKTNVQVDIKERAVHNSAPRVVSTTPAVFDDAVSPSLKTITVTFDQPMMDRSWSWTGGGDTYPETTGRPRYDSSRTTCSLPVKLEPGKVYRVGINSPSYKNFKNPNRVPAKRYVILFATKDKDGKPTPIPEELITKAKSVNERAQKMSSEPERKAAIQAKGKKILKKMAEVNRYWLIRPPAKVKSYSYDFTWFWSFDPPDERSKTFKVKNSAVGSAIRRLFHSKEHAAVRQGIAYYSLLHKLVADPSAAVITEIKESDKVIRLDFTLKDFMNIRCGNGISGSYYGSFSNRVEVGSLWLDAEKMVPVKASAERMDAKQVYEYLSDYVAVGKNHYVPLRVKIDNGDTQHFDWKFRLYEPGLWLFDESHYRVAEDEPKMRASISNVKVNGQPAHQVHLPKIDIAEPPVDPSATKTAKRSPEQIPYTQEMFNDIQPDGTILFKTTVKKVNRTGRNVSRTSFINSKFVEVTGMSDSAGRALKFTVRDQGEHWGYDVVFNEPVLPGEVMERTSEGTMKGLVKPVPGSKDTFQYFMRHWPAAGQPTLRIETYLLPEGAELISTTPEDMQRRTKDGRIELHVEKMIPPGGSITTAFQYRLIDLEKIVEQAVMTISTCAESDPRVKESLESLQGLDEQAVVKEVVKFLDSDKNTVRRSAIYILWKGNFESIESAVPHLQNLCSHEEEYTRGMAALALGTKKVEPSFDTLCNMTLNDSSAYARRCAAYALGLMGNPEAKDVLEKALKDSDFNVRNNAEAALTMLSQIEKPKSTQPVDHGDSSGPIILQSLIDSARPGGTVTIPKGVYTEPIEITKPLTLKGQSRPDCIFEVTADKPAIFIDTKGKGRVTIEDLTIKWQLATSDKNIEYPFALGVKDSRTKVKNCNFVPLGNFKRSPVAIRAVGFSNLTIDGCRFEGFGFAVFYNEGTEGAIRDSLIMNCQSQGITIFSGATVDIVGNIITGSNKHAVRNTGGTLRMKDNLIINNANRGVYLGNKSASGTITNNIIMGNGTGISGFARSKVKIENNLCLDNSFAGIDMRDSCSFLIRNNILNGNARGLALFKETGKNSNKIGKNTFWKNKVDAENFRKTANSITAEPRFADPDNGDFSLKSGPALEHKQGLTNPQVLKTLWKIWQNRANKNEPFSAAGQTNLQVEVEKTAGQGGASESLSEQSVTQNRVEEIIGRMAEVNRYWLIGPPPEVKRYSYEFALYQEERPTLFEVADPSAASRAIRQGITYNSLFHKLATDPSAATYTAIEEGNGTIRLDFRLKKSRIGSGNGVTGVAYGSFSRSVEGGTFWIDAEKMVPVKAECNEVYEYFSDYVAVDKKHYVPLRVKIDNGDTQHFDWKFRLYEPGLWLFDESHYLYNVEGREPVVAASISNVRINEELSEGTGSGKETYKSSGAIVDVDSPRVVSVWPGDGATEVEPATELRIRFDRPMNPGKTKLRWKEGQYRKFGSIRYDESLQEFVLPVELESGCKYRIIANEWHPFRERRQEGFVSVDGVDAEEYEWSFSTKGIVRAADTSKPKVVSVSPASGSKIALVSELKIVFDQPIAAHSFKFGLPGTETKSGWPRKPLVLRQNVRYNADKTEFTVPLVLPPNWNGSVELSGFVNTGGAEAEPIVLKYSTEQEVFSPELLKRLAEAAKSRELIDVLKAVRNTRSNIKSLSETVHTVWDFGRKLELKQAIFKMQGDRQFVTDITDQMGIPFLVGSDGQNCWFYHKREKEELVAVPFEQVHKKNVSICDFAGLSKIGVSKAINDYKLEYAGMDILDGRKCHLIRSWDASLESDYVNCSVSVGWIDVETNLLVQAIDDGGFSSSIRRFYYDRINEVIPDSEFSPESLTDIEPSEPRPLDDKYNTRFIRAMDGSGGRMSVHWGETGPSGTRRSSGLN